MKVNFSLFILSIGLSNLAQATTIDVDQFIADSAGKYTPLIVAGDPFSVSNTQSYELIEPNDPYATFAGIGSIYFEDAGYGYMGTGTPISKRHILTAAHVLDITGDGQSDVGSSAVTFNTNNDGDLTYQLGISSIDIHPDFTGFNNPFISDDLAILTLAEDLPDDVPIYEMFRGDLQGQNMIVMAGYGDSGDGYGVVHTEGTRTVKRDGYNHIDVIYSDNPEDTEDTIFAFDFDDPEGFYDIFGTGEQFTEPYEATIGHGDSGGPAFLLDDNFDILGLIGVNTFGLAYYNNAPYFGSIGGGMFLPSYFDWIDDVVAMAPISQVVTEPASFILLILGLAGLAVVRRKQRSY
ncbi:MAG: hypothetical protein COA99_19125 [Moraxellaceae bacterium]|nr:MAG: hypothetical protein COA99_19125 [Moraxellaceae bacterium]